MIQRIYNAVYWRLKSLRWQWHNALYQLLLTRLKLSFTLPSQVNVSVSSFADWSIYNDIFVCGEYDQAIRQAFASSGQKPVRILDLGANVGFFLKRVLHLRRLEFPNSHLDIIGVEGAPATFKQLTQQAPVFREAEKVQLIHGLAGQKEGSAMLAINPFHAMSGLTFDPKKKGVFVPFVDLDQLTASWESISLLKCDIEGAEQMVLENYSPLFRKVNLAVFEFHLNRVDLEKCRALLSSAGLFSVEICHQNEHLCVEIFTRRPVR